MQPPQSRSAHSDPAIQIANDNWFVLDSGACAPAFNMALDETLLESAAELGRPLLRFYGWTQPAASFGYFQRIADVERATHLRPLVRRPTGGGLVPHDSDWTYSVVIPPGHSWYALRASDSYERMHHWIQSAFTSLGMTVELATCCRKELPGQCFAGYEKFDVVSLGRKIAGAAQRRTKAGLLIQGSVQPTGRTITRAQWQNAMCANSGPDTGARFERWEPSRNLLQRAEQLAAEKYSRDEFNRRR